METKILLLNAAPMSGKDFLVDELQELFHLRVEPQEFKEPLYRLVQLIYSIKCERFWEVYNDRSLKEQKLFVNNTKSIRDLMIEVSEDLIKPFYGRDYFGKVAVENIEDGKLNVFSDCFGDEDEIQPLIDTYGKDNIICIRIKSKHSDFIGDSRRYLETDKIKCFDVWNDMKTEWVINQTTGILTKEGFI